MQDSRFARCHRSFVVNLSDVASIGGREVVTLSGKVLPYSKKYAEAQTRFMTRMLEGGQV